MSTYTTPLGTFDSTTGDGALGSSVLVNNDPPPVGSYTFGPAYDGTVFIIKDNRLYYCKPKRPEAWPADYYIEVGNRQEPGKMGLFHNGQPYYFTLNQIFYIQGTGNSTFLPAPMKARCGVQSSRGAVSVGGHGIFHTGPDGIYLWSNGTDRNITDELIGPLFRGESRNGIPAVYEMSSSWLHHYKSWLYFGYSSTANGTPDNIIRMHLDTKKISHFEYGAGVIKVMAVTNDDANQRLLGGDSNGWVRVLEDDSSSDDAVSASSDEEISWETQSKDFTLSTRAHFPRWVKYDMALGTGAASVTGELLLDDSVHQTHSITASRQTKRRLVGEGNGNRAAVRLSGTGDITIYSTEFE